MLSIGLQNFRGKITKTNTLNTNKYGPLMSLLAMYEKTIKSYFYINLVKIRKFKDISTTHCIN